MIAQIQALPADVVHLMVAGEVIDSLAAVVRELAENALDAGATRITISIWTDQWRVRVADNGVGISLADLQQAALPHSTSKIRDRQDLWQVKSLGFRGEALHSLAQLSELEICSRAAAPDGWRIRYAHSGEPVQTETIAIAPGMVVTVDHLFGNWLPRRQGLPPPAQQLRAIQLAIAHLALCHPQVTWRIEQNDRPWFAIWSGSTAKQVLPQLVREVQGGDLRELTLRALEPSDRDSLDASLYLLLGLPDRCHRHRPDWVKVAVNGRVVKVPELEQAIFGALRRILPRDRHPVCFVHLTLPPNQVDWNRHPAKAELYLHQMEHWQKQVAEAIAQTLRLQPEATPDATYTSRVGKLVKAAEAAGGYGQREISPDSPDPAYSASLLPLKALSQVHQMYILAEHPTGMWLVEQHIAHERVLYEQLRDRWQIVAVEPPIVLHQLSALQVEQLQRIGLSVEPFGDRLWAVRSIPEVLAEREDCSEALLELSLGGDLEAALVATACRTAIRNGTPLSQDAMQTLLDQWQQTHSPRTCPHGRPIYLSLEESSLSRFFRRHWVIGKSHGI